MAASSQNQNQSQPESEPEPESELSVIYFSRPAVTLEKLGLELVIGGYDPEYPVDESIPPDPQRPLSPFALRYGVSSDPFWRLYHPDNRAHSSLAPEFPNANGLPLGPIPKPSYDELNRLFSAEREQTRGANYGPRTWQLPVLGERLSFGGNVDDADPAFTGGPYSQWKDFLNQCVRVHPDTWLSCFQANHWFDLRSNLLDSLRMPTPGLNRDYMPYPDKTWWSMDNEAVANNVRLALEVATRVLRQLCAEQNEWCVPEPISLSVLLCPRPQALLHGQLILNQGWTQFCLPLQ